MFLKIKQFFRDRVWKHWFEKYERLLMPATLILGTAADFVTFKNINIESTFLILGIYYIIAALCILILNTKHNERMRIVAKFLIQFTFGALLSASLVFYWFSGVFSASWPIMILLALLMISNEVFNHLYLKPSVQLSVFYFVSFSLLALALPFTFNSLEPILFLLSGVISFAIVWIGIILLSKYVKSINQIQKYVLFVMIVIFISMQSLYFSNIIPPIPLSLREVGVYHNVYRSGNSYAVVSEKVDWWNKIFSGNVIHVEKNNKVFVYSAIFAPTKLKTTIVHNWQFYDVVQNHWVEKDELSYSLYGGRDGGYRGYSVKSNLEKGKWRVKIETARGQVIGSTKFIVEETIETPKLEKIIK